MVVPPHLDVLRGRAAELDDRRDPAHDLLHCRPDQRRIGAELLELARVLDQREQAAGRGVAGGLVARHHQQDEVRQELPLGDGLPHHFGGGERGGEHRRAATGAAPPPSGGSSRTTSAPRARSSRSWWHRAGSPDPRSRRWRSRDRTSASSPRAGARSSRR